jgi:hypothetical protein
MADFPTAIDAMTSDERMTFVRMIAAAALENALRDVRVVDVRGVEQERAADADDIAARV